MMAKRMKAEEKKMGHCFEFTPSGGQLTVDSGQECRVRHDDTATATSLVSGKH